LRSTQIRAKQQKSMQYAAEIRAIDRPDETARATL